LELTVVEVIRTPDWVKDAIFYQIFPDRFAKSERVQKPSNLEPWDTPPTPGGFKGGDLVGVLEHIDYLDDLGINAIYFNPIFQSASNHRYHTHDYYQVDPLLGGNQALHDLIDVAHSRGIKVVLDGVFNHASRGFFQFNHILECGEMSPYLDWFTVKGFPLNAYDSSQKPNYEAWIGLHALPKFNTANPQVREFIWDVAAYWIKFGVDGWRLDVPSEIDDDEFWREFRLRVRNINPETYIVGEIWHEAQRWLGGDQFDAVMNYIITRVAISFFGAQSIAPLFPGGGYPILSSISAEDFAKEVERSLGLYHWEITSAQLNLLSSHDTPRFLTMVQGDKSALKLAMLFQMTLPGAPTVYYGDEIGLTGSYDPGSRGSIPWGKQDTWDMDLFNFVRETIRLRKAHAALRRGFYRTLLAEGELYAFERVHENQRIVVAFNTAKENKELHIPVGPDAGHPRVLFGEPQAVALHEGRIIVKAPARSGIVLSLES
jgi:glycosidase